MKALETFTNAIYTECIVCESRVFGSRMFCSEECQTFAETYRAYFGQGRPDPFRVMPQTLRSRVKGWLKAKWEDLLDRSPMVKCVDPAHEAHMIPRGEAFSDAARYYCTEAAAEEANDGRAW